MGCLFGSGAGDLRKHFARILVPGLDTLEVQHGKSADFAHLDGKGHIDDTIHGAGHDGNGKIVFSE